ncbi:asparaginase [Virgibacillus dakarensis]|uniref:Asparaginase n=1 Tax=Lentibacillus populi TaxID=1827502 RepID=A0A9W5TV30_9BACI|nr:asparaginase [Lentibacillus populi]MTW87197.1 asparaginase [Virgibacillus dakarensis]GGB31952.1 asparaginase [Lentibacillus populi]
MENRDLIEAKRGKEVESYHHMNIAVVDSKGDLLYHLGDPEHKIYARSSMKPLQAIPLVETGAADYYYFSDADLALCTASHNGEPMHTDRVISILKRAGLDDSYLRCGIHNPRWEDTYRKLILEGKEITSLYNNCSGKHSGMLVTAKYMGESTEKYYELEHPVQQRILSVISEVCDYPKSEIAIGVDGCGVPVHALPIKNLAYGFARMAKPNIFDDKRKYAVECITNAMVSAPEMVGGTNRFCTDFMRAGKGRFFGKAGAEGVYCIGDKETGLGIAVKVLDGNGRASSPAAVEVLAQLGLLNNNQLDQLKKWHYPKLFNTRDEVIGELNPIFQLNKTVNA